MKYIKKLYNMFQRVNNLYKIANTRSYSTNSNINQAANIIWLGTSAVVVGGGLYVNKMINDWHEETINNLNNICHSLDNMNNTLNSMNEEIINNLNENKVND